MIQMSNTYINRFAISKMTYAYLKIRIKFGYFWTWPYRECVSTGAAGARTRRPFAPADFEAFSTIETRRF